MNCHGDGRFYCENGSPQFVSKRQVGKKTFEKSPCQKFLVKPLLETSCIANNKYQQTVKHTFLFWVNKFLKNRDYYFVFC